MMTSMKRYFTAGGSDIIRNDCLKIMIGRHPCQKYYGVQASLFKAMKE